VSDAFFLLSFVLKKFAEIWEALAIFTWVQFLPISLHIKLLAPSINQIFYRLRRFLNGLPSDATHGVSM